MKIRTLMACMTILLTMVAFGCRETTEAETETIITDTIATDTALIQTDTTLTTTMSVETQTGVATDTVSGTDTAAYPNQTDTAVPPPPPTP